jgi:hypothetical protein
MAGSRSRYRNMFRRNRDVGPKAHDHGRTNGARASWYTIACLAGAQFIGDRTMGHTVTDQTVAVACKGVAGGRHLPLSRGA